MVNRDQQVASGALESMKVGNNSSMVASMMSMPEQPVVGEVPEEPSKEIEEAGDTVRIDDGPGVVEEVQVEAPAEKS